MNLQDQIQLITNSLSMLKRNKRRPDSGGQCKQEKVKTLRSLIICSLILYKYHLFSMVFSNDLRVIYFFEMQNLGIIIHCLQIMQLFLLL